MCIEQGFCVLALIIFHSICHQYIILHQIQATILIILAIRGEGNSEYSRKEKKNTMILKKTETVKTFSPSPITFSFSKCPTGLVYLYDRLNNSLLDNRVYNDVIFNNVTFKDVVMNHVVFLNCTFMDCLFSNVRSSKTFFKYVSISCFCRYSCFLLDADIDLV